MAGLWIFPGSFDPATRGHEDLIRRAAALCDHLVVAVLINPDKKGFLPLKKRLELLERICADIDNASVESYNGLLADYVREMVEWADQQAVFSFRRLSLVLAGHFCGGQWRLPALGPLYVPEKGWFPGDAGVVGMQRVNSINQYIGAGLEASDFYPMPGRLFNTPNVALLSYTARIE